MLKEIPVSDKVVRFNAPKDLKVVLMSDVMNSLTQRVLVHLTGKKFYHKWILMFIVKIIVCPFLTNN